MNFRDKYLVFRVINHFGWLLFLLLISSASNAAERIGLVKTYSPVATVIREGVETSLKVGSEIFEGDTIVTDGNGAVGIIFKDGAVLTLGPSGKLLVENFLFKPAEKNVSFISKIFKGTVAFASGAIGRISPESVQFETPTATLGLRGTKILIEVE
ncbi:MAG: FecR domain-containing protein [Methylococcaceae bacterium]|nr:FecR domain-containing protein [Methylococcaceae bacterium]